MEVSPEPTLAPTPKGEGVDLNDGFGPFVFHEPGDELDDQLEFLIKANVPEGSGYADSVVYRAEEDYKSIKKGTQLEANLRNQEKELKSRIQKAHTTSRNPKVRERMKEIRDKLQAELTRVQDELKDIQIRKQGR